MRVCMGGTFDIIHKGHEMLFSKAFELGDEVYIGLASDEMAAGRKRVLRPFEERKRNLEAFLRRKKYRGFVVSKIDDRFGPAATDDQLDAIVVSEETKRTALELNEARVTRRLRPLAIHTVPLALAEDSCPISSTRIRAGEIDREGRMLRPLVANVGSSNEVKLQAVKNIFLRLFRNAKVHGVSVEQSVPAQPYEKECIQGAINRAKEALRQGDYGIGIEAGLFWNAEAGQYFDVQHCAVVDKLGAVTLGHGPGFYYPPEVERRLRGGATVGEAMEEVTGIKEIGRKMGAIGYLSRGKMNRERLTEIAVLMAMIPRIRRDLYGQKKD